LEDLILQHPAVAEAAVVGLPDQKWGERPVALVVPKRDSGRISLPKRDFCDWLKGWVDQGTLSKWAHPRPRVGGGQPAENQRRQAR
jgi:fatty-acyl-CoA synthase